ncbi:unnamed protein product [Cuscuta campestris]|uniref:RNase H type-1 domain-containing protein n=1 Tax=Cuscuta campestris TaxID=132261 RepID=A0A484LW76_9ASTE|nr:unnamed protein product [Cuscuta campestris]
MPLQAPMAVASFQAPVPQPSPFQPQLVSAMTPVNLAGALNATGPSRPPQATDPQITPDGHCVSIESDDGEWDIPRAHKKKKGKNIRPATSRNSAFERMGDREEGQRKSAKQRLGQSVAHVSAFARLGEVREAEPARTRCSRSNQQGPARTRASHQEEEAESQPRLPVANRLTIPNDRIQQMEAKLERLEKKVGEKNDRDKPLAGSPFTTRVHLTPFPRKVKIDAPRFTGKEDPEIHLDSFNQSATMNGCTDEEKCLLFVQTLRNRATEWFNKLRPGGIDSFNDLASKFKAKFQENCTKRKKFTYLSENLTQFLTRWKEEVDKVEEMDDKTVLSLLLNGLHAGELYKEFCRKPPATYQEAYHTAWEFAEAETQLRAKREAEHGHKSKPVQVKKEEAPGPRRPRHHYDPVIRVVNTEEGQEIREAPVIPPEKPTGQTGRQWSGTYCSYHRSDSHNTSECKSVKGLIRQMIDSGELGKDYLQKAQEKSFTGDTVEAEGSIVLPVELGSDEKTVWKKMRFIVVDIKCVHSAILGRPGINRVGAVISMPHLCMKFHTPGGVGEVNGDQRNARECYARAVKKMTKGVNVISQEITKGETREKLEPEAETVEIELDPGDSSRMVRIGANLPEDLKVEITRVLQEYAGIFAWSVADMPGIDRSVICHRLAVREGSRPVRQKKRYLASDRRDFVKKEVKDLLSVVLRNSTSSGRMVKWAMMLTQFHIEYRPRSAIKGQALADFVVEMTGLTPDLPVNKPTEQWWEMAVDGASGPRGYGGGIVSTTPEGFKIYHAIVFNFKLTKNEAEYEALAGGLRLAQALKINWVSIKSDSSLIVGQVTGNMEAREERMAQYKDLVLALLKGFEEFKIAQIPRAENADADLLSKLTQYAPEHVSKLARVEILDRASIEKLEVAAITAGSQFDRSNLVGADDHWMYDPMGYLMDGSLPEQDDQARKVKLRAPRFQVLDGKLYKRAFRGPLLRCPTNREAERVIAEVHEGVCAAHQMSRTLSQRIILLGYYWPTIVQDCERYIQKCRTCQVFYKYPGRPATYYHPVSNVIPFARFGVDIIGAFPVTQGGKKFVIVAIDYFTKWIEAEALANITTQQYFDEFIPRRLPGVVYRVGKCRQKRIYEGLACSDPCQ